MVDIIKHPTSTLRNRAIIIAIIITVIIIIIIIIIFIIIIVIVIINIIIQDNLMAHGKMQWGVLILKEDEFRRRK